MHFRKTAHHPSVEASVSSLSCGGCNSPHGRASYTDEHVEHSQNRTRCIAIAQMDLSAATIIPAAREHMTDSQNSYSKEG